jgi:preprotein translocase subunit SecD
MSRLPDNWRIGMLAVLIVVSGIVLFVPGATLGGGDDGAAGGENATGDGLTNLQYGIQLEGGSRLRAPAVGITAENVEFGEVSVVDVRQTVASELGVDPIDVEVRPSGRTVEVFNETVSQSELAATLQELGYDVSEDDVRAGVTQATRADMVEIIQRKVDASALSGVTVREVQTPTGRNLIEIESTGRDIADLRNILEERGVVRVYAYYPLDNGTWTRDQVLGQGDFESIGSARRLGENEYSVTVTLDDSGDVPEEFVADMQGVGFDRPTVCQAPNRSPTGCMQATLNGEVVFNGSIRRDLATSFADGSFTEDPTFSMTTRSREEARNLELSLKVGQPLPAPLAFDAGQQTELQPSLAERFKSLSLIVGILTVITVSGVVYVRYGDVRVAAPMVLTALAEVFLLLGFVAAIQFPMNLSHIAGFIAVIGTGVDDLIIIADEILQQEGVATGRVFQNRFRKAFWVIGAAAATTIVAMSPLMVLSLGDLTGFAIVTIVGVLIGVLVTRPAYGDILRNLILREREKSS